MRSEIVYAPAYPDPRPGHGGLRFEPRLLETGEQVGVAFRTTAHLVRELGEAQPWVALPLDRLQQVLGAAGIERVLLDPDIPAGADRWDTDELVALTEALQEVHVG